MCQRHSVPSLLVVLLFIATAMMHRSVGVVGMDNRATDRIGIVLDDMPPTFDTAHITMPVEHFDLFTASTFNLRYLVNYDGCRQRNASVVQPAAETIPLVKCPILFYCGGEDDIGAFANATGFLWQLRTRLQAILVYAEHRYYGTSVPATDNAPILASADSRIGRGRTIASSSSSSFEYLSSQQALADFALLASDLKGRFGGGPVIAIGGSYGGMLAAWLRQK